MDDIRSLARDPNHRRNFEKLLYLAAQRGDADLVAERLSWGIDPNCAFAKGRTPLIANVCGSCPNAATVRALLESRADPSRMDEAGLTALDYARRKLMRLQARPARRRRKSPSLDENNQLRLGPAEQVALDKMRRQPGGADGNFLRIWWQERLRAARRVFNDPEQVEKIVAQLEAAGGTSSHLYFTRHRMRLSCPFRTDPPRRRQRAWRPGVPLWGAKRRWFGQMLLTDRAEGSLKRGRVRYIHT